ncbi:helix-turn-helix domain-containing protein [Deltaproteobacteria bacterium PRO3]|nr:helix-turn-helix domain-containing protein [Deltaproteobacteria bacterium PRO3]
MIEKKPSPLLQKIFEVRKAKGITLKQLGKVIGNISESGASSVENGDVPLKAEYLPAVAKLLGVKVWELFSSYDPRDLGPLQDEEKSLVLNFRGIDSPKNRKIILETAEEFAKIGK